MIRKKHLKFLGFIFLILGILNILGSINLTGFIIFPNSIIFKPLIGVVFLSVSIFLFLLENMWDRYRVGLVAREYNTDVLNPVQAVIKINNSLFPEGIKINGVEYHGGMDNLTIRTKDEYIPVRLRDSEKAKDLSFALYEIALINDTVNKKNCEIHLGPNTSTKHHVAGFEKVLSKFEEKYKRDIEELKSAA